MVHVERPQADSKLEMLSSTRHADLLEREVSLLQAKVEQQAATIRDLHAEALEQARLREAAEEEVVEQREDIVEQACDQGDLQHQIQRLDKERAELRGNLVRLKSDLEKMEHRYEEAQRHLADKEELARKPEMELAQKERKNQQLQKQLEANAVLIKTLKEQLEEARGKSAEVESDVVEEETRERLLQRLSSAHRTQAAIEEKCWQLEEQLEDRDREMEKARGKLQSLEDRLLEEERCRTSEERSREVADESSEDSHIQALRGDIKDRDSRLQCATERIADLEKTVFEQQSKLQASGSSHQGELQTMKKRCRDLEIAGKKLLVELDDKDRQIHATELAAHAAQRRLHDLEAMSAYARPSSAIHAKSSTEGPTPAVAEHSLKHDFASVQRVWVSGSCRDSGSEVRASGSGGESSFDETSGTRRLRRGRLPQNRLDDIWQAPGGDGKRATPLRTRHGSPALLRPRESSEPLCHRSPFARREDDIVIWRGRRHREASSDDHAVDIVGATCASSSREQSESDSGHSGHSGTRGQDDAQASVRRHSRHRGGTPLRRLLEESSRGDDDGQDAQLLRNGEEVWKWRVGDGTTSRSEGDDDGQDARLVGINEEVWKWRAGAGTTSKIEGRGDNSDEWFTNASWYSRYAGDHSLRGWNDAGKWDEGDDSWYGYTYSSGWNAYS